MDFASSVGTQDSWVVLEKETELLVESVHGIDGSSEDLNDDLIGVRGGHGNRSDLQGSLGLVEPGSLVGHLERAESVLRACNGVCEIESE